MSDKIEWIRPSGSTITTADNEANAEYAKANGWEKVKPKAKQKKAVFGDDNSNTDSGRRS